MMIALLGFACSCFQQNVTHDVNVTHDPKTQVMEILVWDIAAENRRLIKKLQN